MYVLVRTAVGGLPLVVVFWCDSSASDFGLGSDIPARKLRVKRLNIDEKRPRPRLYNKTIRIPPSSIIKKKLRGLPGGTVTKEEHVVPQLSSYSHNETQSVSYLGVANWTAEETTAWLSCQRYQAAHLATLGSYSGADLLRLTRDQLVQLVGLADGLRLYNALHAPAPPPALTIYVTADGRLHRPLYLTAATRAQLRSRLAAAFSLDGLSTVVVAGPAGIRILVSDELVQHIPDHSAFTIQLLPGDAGDGSIQALLIPSNCQIT